MHIRIITPVDSISIGIISTVIIQFIFLFALGDYEKKSDFWVL